LVNRVYLYPLDPDHTNPMSPGFRPIGADGAVMYEYAVVAGVAAAFAGVAITDQNISV
jgi:hypothetical protein